MSELLAWMHNNIVELQTGGLVVTGIILLLALVLLNRAASELYKSRSQRVKSEQAFERIQSLLAARNRVEPPFESIRGGRITMSGPIMRSSRPVSPRTETKPTPRTEPKMTPFATRVSSRSRLVN